MLGAMLTIHETTTTDRGPIAEAEPAKLRVIVADDHPLYRQGIVRALESTGAFEVIHEAPDGASALELIRRHEPDVAVLDVRMPGMDGIDVTAALARYGPAVPVVLLSAFEDEPLVTAGIEAGAAAYVSKTSDRAAICLDVAAAARSNEPRSPGAIHGCADLGRNRTRGWTPRLTSQEHRLLRLASAGWDKPELRFLTGADEPTLRRRLDSILVKLGADDIDEAIRIARRRGIVR
jgi:two-component system nitrate/nitrite response regulator NarL